MSGDKRELLIHWLTQRKLTTREFEAAEKDLRMWLKRSKMALDAGRIDLARAAKDQAVIARDKVGATSLRLKEIEVALEELRAEPLVPNEAAAKAALARAELAAAEFAKMGIDSRFAALGDPNDVTLPPTTAGEELGDLGDSERGALPESSMSLERRSALDEAEALLNGTLDDVYDPSDTENT